MSQPFARAERVHWPARDLAWLTATDERIAARSDAYGLRRDDGTVLIDPLPVTRSVMETILPVTAIVLTAGCHQRAAWEWRRRTGAAVWAPWHAVGMEEEADQDYASGDTLPAGLLARHAPGSSADHHVLLGRACGRDGGVIEADGQAVEQRVSTLFCGDLLLALDDTGVRLLPPAHRRDPEAYRQSVGELSGRDVGWLLPAHGAPRRLDGTLSVPPDEPA